jgi:hypothetical protein
MTYATVASLVAMAGLAPDARAQAQVYITPSAVYISGPRAQPGPTAIRVQTTVSVPDGGTVSAGGYTSVSDTRKESGAPILGNLPHADRDPRNVGSGRAVTSVRVSAGVRIISLR